MIDGVTIKIGGKDYVVPPLNIATLRKFADVISGRAEKEGETAWDGMLRRVDVIHAALLRNYPELTLDELSEGLDLANINDVFRAVMAMNKIEVREAMPGESAPVQVEQSIGTESSPQ